MATPGPMAHRTNLSPDMTTSIERIAHPQEREAPRRSTEGADPRSTLSLLVGPAVARALRLEALGGPLAQPAIAVDDLLMLTEPDDREALAAMIRWAHTPGDRKARLLLRLRRADGEQVSVVGTIGGTAADSVELSLDLDDAAAARRAETH